MFRARVRGPSTNLASQERSAIPGTLTAPFPGNEEPSGVGATPIETVSQHLSDCFSQLLSFLGVERPRGTRRVDARAPQHFVSQQVADTGHSPLIKQASLQGHIAHEHAIIELAFGHAEHVGTQTRLMRIEDHPTQPTGIPDAEIAPIIEMENEAIPFRVVAPRGVLQTVDRGGPINEEPTRHAETEPETNLVLEVQNQELSSSTGADNPLALDGIGHRTGRGAILQEVGIARVHR